MMECTDLFWHEFYGGAGIFLGLLGPLMGGVFGFVLAMFRQQQRHEACRQDARLQEQQPREDRYRVVRGGQG